MQLKLLLSTATLLGCLATTEFAQSTFQPLGIFNQIPTDMTPDGVTIVGTSLFGTGVWMYDDTNGFVDLMGSGGNPAVSDDGTIVHGDLLDQNGINNAAMWDATNGWQIVGPFPGVTSGCPDLSDGYNMSNDGNVIVGLGWTGCVATAFRWDATTGMVDLGFIDGQNSSRANGVDGDGTVIVGWDTSTFGNRRPAIWVNGAEQLLGSLDPNDPVDGPGEAYVVTPDGSIVYGESNGSTFRWTSTGGLEDLGKIPGSVAGDRAFPRAVSQDGSVVVGENGDTFFGTPFRAYYYTDSLGLVDLLQYLNATGANVPAGWTLTTLKGVSADGTMVVGWGTNPSGTIEVFRATVEILPPPCGGNDVATATFRADAAGVNLTGYTAPAPVMGSAWTPTVRNGQTGFGLALVVGYASPLDLSLAAGSVLVNVADPAGELLGLSIQPGSFNVSFSLTIPLDPALCGFSLSTQGISLGSAGFGLHNAFDLVVGDI